METPNPCRIMNTRSLDIIAALIRIRSNRAAEREYEVAITATDAHAFARLATHKCRGTRCHLPAMLIEQILSRRNSCSTNFYLSPDAATPV
jgi:hypothetical protein